MPRSLSEHLQEADNIIDGGGMKSLLPTKDAPAPVRVNVSETRLLYAAWVRKTVCPRDTTGGRTLAYLRANDEAASTMLKDMTQDQERRIEQDMRRMRSALRRKGVPVGRGR